MSRRPMTVIAVFFFMRLDVIAVAVATAAAAPVAAGGVGVGVGGFSERGRRAGGRARHQGRGTRQLRLQDLREPSIAEVI